MLSDAAGGCRRGARARRTDDAGPPSSAMRMLTLALMRLGRRDDAERQLAILVCEAEQSGLRMSIHSALLFRSALATASGRFAEGKALAAEAAQ